MDNNFYEDLIGKYVMIRTYSAGVHFGILSKVQPTKDGYYPVKLTSAKRVFKWAGACSLSQLSVDGTTNTDTLISLAIPSQYLCAIEINEMTPEAVNKLNKLKTWKI